MTQMHGRLFIVFIQLNVQKILCSCDILLKYFQCYPTWHHSRLWHTVLCQKGGILSHC
jgi:hypothetical protein